MWIDSAELTHNENTQNTTLRRILDRDYVFDNLDADYPLHHAGFLRNQK